MDPERRAALSQPAADGVAPPLSVVVPTLNEVDRLPTLLERIRELGPDVQIIVSDGGSTDGTVALARDVADAVVEGQPGRGEQLNRGAELALAPTLFFLHADSTLNDLARDTLLQWLADPRAGHRPAVFQFALDARGVGWRVIEWGQRLRQRVTGLAFGDQGLVVPTKVFHAVGGYPNEPIMEDAAMLSKLKARGPIQTLETALPTSARRYRRDGRIRSVVRNQVLLLLRAAGVSPNRLARAYRPRAHPAGPPVLPKPLRSRATLLVFAKAPVPGRVKTRLAADVGPAAAARFYGNLARRVVAQVRSDRYQTVVCYDPPDAESDVRAWLGDELDYVAQPSGDLGNRMEGATRHALRSAGAVCVIGTDAPDVDASVVQRALDALMVHDVVLGPASDGGYYLIAMKQPQPLLFEGVPWSSATVLEATLQSARRAGLRVHLLPTLTDIDHLEDVPPALRSLLET